MAAMRPQSPASASLRLLLLAAVLAAIARGARVDASPACGPADPIVVEDALRTVHDPEIPVNIFDLGLIYDVDRKQNGDVYITMSLTAPGCPVAGEMPGQVAAAVAAADGVGAVSVELVWSPPWTPERMSEDARLALDF